MFQSFNRQLSIAASIAAASLGAATAHAQSDFGPWDWVNPSPQGNTLEGVYLLDANTAFAVGDAGTILRTTDAGDTWTQVPNPVSDSTLDPNTLLNLHLVDANALIAAGHGPTILRSTDGGLTWTERVSPVENSSQLNVSFTPGGVVGYAGGSRDGGPRLLKTTDGGQNWVDLLPAEPLDACNVFPIGSDQFGFCTISGISFPDADTGYVWGGNYHKSIRRTDDGGATWAERILPCGSCAIRGGHFFDADNGFFVVGQGGLVSTYHTSDGGLTWSQHFLTSGTGGATGEPFFLDRNTGWVPGYESILRTDDGGVTWTAHDLNLPVWTAIRSVHFSDADNGFAVGDGGVIMRTTDGGHTWTPRTSGHEIRQLWAVDFADDANTGFAVGLSGKDCGTCPVEGPMIVRTTDGGESWTALDHGMTTPVTLRDVAVIDANTVVAVGNDGGVLRSNDGGATWTAHDTGVTSHLHGVSFVDANNGWAVGVFAILRTADGGNTWIVQHSGDEVLYSVTFTDAMNGWAVGALAAPGAPLVGTIMHTTDGGNTWTTTTPPPPDDGGQPILRDVTFVDADTGWAAGDPGILHTNDGGATWTWQATFWLTTGIACVDANNCTAVSRTGRIFRTEDGGDTWIVESRRLPNLGLNAGLAMIDADTGVVVGGVSGSPFEPPTNERASYGYILRRSGDDGACSLADLVDPLGAIDVFDLLAYLDLWFADNAAADIDGAAGIDVFDLLTYLDAWFAGCD